MKEVIVNLNTPMVISLSEAGRLEWCNNYNKDLYGVVKDFATSFSLNPEALIWEVFYLLGENGFSKELFKTLLNSEKILIKFGSGDIEINFDTEVEIDWTDNGKVVLAQREHDMTNGAEREKESTEYQTKMKIPFFRLGYYLTKECYMGNVKMPMTKNNSFTVYMPL